MDSGSTLAFAIYWAFRSASICRRYLSIANSTPPQINHKSVMADIKDADTRGTMIFAWWMACLADAYSALYYRRKPML